MWLLVQKIQDSWKIFHYKNIHNHWLTAMNAKTFSHKKTSAARDVFILRETLKGRPQLKYVDSLS